MRRTLLIALSGILLLCTTQADAQIFHKRKKLNKSTSADNNAEPDKILYDRATDDIKHGRHEVGRLNLQTLINTYPDSEYLAKAKLAIADSYYKEGGTANMTQAIQGYKDFIVFFPFLPEATYAQMQVAMAHYRQMEKPDRDRTEARDAEEEFQTFLRKYPKDPLAPKAEQRLRDVQEVLAEGDYRIGYYYFVKGDRRAAAARLISVTNRYPLYSRSDHALWMLGDIFEKSEHKEIAANYYARIVRNYPLSSLAPDAKSRLTEFKVPIPQPDPTAVAWMTAEQNAPRQHTSLIKKPLGLIKNGPGTELQASAKTGLPNLQPEADTSSATDILTGGGKPQLGGGGSAGSGIVATVKPGESGQTGGAATGSSDVQPAATDAPATDNGSTSAPATTDSTGGATTGSSTIATPAPSATTGTASATTTDSASGTTSAQDSSTNNSTDNKKESTSKKKKGLKKLVPW